MKASRHVRYLLICLLLLASPWLPATERASVLTWRDQGLQPLGQWLQLLPTADMPLSLEDLPRQDQMLPWQSLERQQLNLGLDNGPRIFRLSLDNPGKTEQLVIALSRSSLSRIALLSRNEAGVWQRQEAGIDTLTLSPPLPVPGYGFLLQAPHGRSTHYLQIETHQLMSTPVLLGTVADMVRHTASSAGWLGFGLGMMCCLFVLLHARLFVSRTLRWSLILMQLSGILFVMTDRGVLGNWWLSLPGMQHGLLEISVLLVQITLVWHTLHLLREREALPHVQLQLLVGIIGLLALVLMVTLVLPQHTRGLLLGLPCVIAILPVLLLWLNQRGRKDNSLRWLLVPTSSWLMLQQLQLAGAMGWLGDWPEPYLPSIVWFATMPVMTTFILHAAARRDRELRREHADPGSSAPLHVLVVEDNEWVRDVMRGLLGKLGVKVTLMQDGQTALSWMKQNPCDLVLMDCDLPGMDGLDATRQWRRHEQRRALGHLPIIAITAHVSDAQRREVIASGMDGFLAKPVDMRTLHETLLRWGRKAAQGAA